MLQDLLFEQLDKLSPSFTSALLINGTLTPTLCDPQHRKRFTVIQSQKGAFDHLTVAGISVIPSLTDITDTRFDVVLFQGSRIKEQNIALLHALPSLLCEGGLLLELFPNDLGASRYEKILQQSYQAEIVSDSKRKARVFGITNFQSNLFHPPLSTDTTATKATFNQGELDIGSQLLATTLAGKLSGAVAEFCSGSGALASELIHSSPHITSLIGYEADIHSYRRSLERASTKLVFAWQDILSLPETKRFETIVVNPPFHDSHGENVALGLSILRKACSALTPGGNLYVVQNNHLTYLKDLGLAKQATILAQQHGFLVWHYAT